MKAQWHERKREIFFIVAALFNTVIVLAWLAMPDFTTNTLGTVESKGSSIEHLFLWLVFLFGAAYAYAAINFSRSKELITLGAIGKTGVFAIVAMHWLDGAVSTTFLAVASFDLLFAVAFMYFLKTKPV